MERVTDLIGELDLLVMAGTFARPFKASAASKGQNILSRAGYFPSYPQLQENSHVPCPVPGRSASLASLLQGWEGGLTVLFEGVALRSPLSGSRPRI